MVVVVQMSVVVDIGVGVGVGVGGNVHDDVDGYCHGDGGGDGMELGG